MGWLISYSLLAASLTILYVADEEEWTDGETVVLCWMAGNLFHLILLETVVAGIKTIVYYCVDLKPSERVLFKSAGERY